MVHSCVQLLAKMYECWYKTRFPFPFNWKKNASVRNCANLHCITISVSILMTKSSSEIPVQITQGVLTPEQKRFCLGKVPLNQIKIFILTFHLQIYLPSLSRDQISALLLSVVLRLGRMLLCLTAFAWAGRHTVRCFISLRYKDFLFSPYSVKCLGRKKTQ